MHHNKKTTYFENQIDLEFSIFRAAWKIYRKFFETTVHKFEMVEKNQQQWNREEIFLGKRNGWQDEKWNETTLH